MKLRARALGLAVGLVSGGAVILATLLSLQIGKGETLNSLGVVFIGYSVSVGGVFLGFLWGLVYGFIGGAALAYFYNMFHKMLYKQ